jgi:predicted DNA-binding transcriptional regulator AlpA
MSDRYLGIDEVAARYPGQTPNSLYTQRHRGEAPGALGVKVGRRILWRESDLEAWFDSLREAQRVPVAS